MEVQASTKAGRGNWSNPVETRTYPERKIDPALFHGFTIIIIIIITIIVIIIIIIIIIIVLLLLLLLSRLFYLSHV